jgi:hypothetical protein
MVVHVIENRTWLDSGVDAVVMHVASTAALADAWCMTHQSDLEADEWYAIFEEELDGPDIGSLRSRLWGPAGPISAPPPRPPLEVRLAPPNLAAALETAVTIAFDGFDGTLLARLTPAGKQEIVQRMLNVLQRPPDELEHMLRGIDAQRPVRA